MGVLLSIAIVLAATAGWLYYLYRLDRNWRDKRAGHIIAIMVVVGAASTIPTLIAYRFNPLEYLRWYSDFAYNFVVVGLTEELIKFLMFIIMARVMRSIREPQDGIIQGAAVGVGFSAVEDIMYGIWSGPQVALIRSIMIGLHALAGGLWGFMWAGAVYENLEKRNRKAYLLAFLSFVPVAAFHSLYNTIWLRASTFDVGAFANLILLAVVFVIVIKGFRWMAARSAYHRFPYTDSTEAMEYIAVGLRVNGKSLILHRRMAIYAIAARDYGEAIKRLRMCLKHSKDNPMLTVFLGIAMTGAGHENAGRELIRGGISGLSPARRRRLDKELGEIIRDEHLAQRVQGIMHPVEELIDEWMEKRRRLGMYDEIAQSVTHRGDSRATRPSR